MWGFCLWRCDFCPYKRGHERRVFNVTMKDIGLAGFLAGGYLKILYFHVGSKRTGNVMPGIFEV
jgi:hypothetical protein